MVQSNRKNLLLVSFVGLAPASLANAVLFLGPESHDRFRSKRERSNYRAQLLLAIIVILAPQISLTSSHRPSWQRRPTLITDVSKYPNDKSSLNALNFKSGSSAMLGRPSRPALASSESIAAFAAQANRCKAFKMGSGASSNPFVLSTTTPNL